MKRTLTISGTLLGLIIAAYVCHIRTFKDVAGAVSWHNGQETNVNISCHSRSQDLGKAKTQTLGSALQKTLTTGESSELHGDMISFILGDTLLQLQFKEEGTLYWQSNSNEYDEYRWAGGKKFFGSAGAFFHKGTHFVSKEDASHYDGLLFFPKNGGVWQIRLPKDVIALLQVGQSSDFPATIY